MRILAPLVLCMTAHTAFAAPTDVIHDAAHGFSFTVPSGYADYPAGRAPGVLYAFTRGNPGDPSFTLIRIEAMGGIIGRGPLVRETVERAARDSVRGTGVELTQFDYRKAKWK